jgi:hypothetical protein
MNTPGGQAPDALERVGMASRSGSLGGVYVAYLQGTNGFLGRPAVWRIGADDVVPGLPKDRGARFMGVATGPQGRLWAYWGRQPGNAWNVYAARSNKPVSRFGTAVKIGAPGRAGSSLFSLEGEGTAPGGTLDLVALVQRSSNDIANWHQRIQPGISLFCSVLANNDVRFTTRDAGVKLPSTIHYAGKTKQTGDDGKLVMVGKPGKHKATATAAGYHGSNSCTVKVPEK